MAREINTTTNIYHFATSQNHISNSCPHEFLAAFNENMGVKMWQVNTMILINAIFAGVIVVIGAYAQRYRHHPLTRFIYLGATALFLPIISYVVSTIGSNSNDFIMTDDKLATTLTAATCHGGFHQYTVVSWAFLVQIIVVNTSVIVAVDDREGRNKGPPIRLLVQGIWTLYLGISTMGSIKTNMWPIHLEFMLFAIFCAKIVLKYYAFEKARKSLAFGRNPCLIFGYMKQLQQQESFQPLAGEDAPPALLVMGEERMQVEKQPHGYVCRDFSGTILTNSISPVTVDKVLQLDDMLAISRPQLKDICLSFSLFKLLRCRFARYELPYNAGSVKTLNFFWSLLLKEGEHARIFGVITDEISFVQDYYFSSLPVSYSKYWLPILSVGISMLSIGYCLVAASFIIMGLLSNWLPKYEHQMRCDFWCGQNYWMSPTQDKNFGFFLFDDIPLLFLLLLVVIAEGRYIASYICSNWTKVALICHYVNHASFQNCHRMQKWFGLLLQPKFEPMRHWDEKIGQSSVLVVHPRTTPLLVLRRSLGLPDLDRSVKIPDTVKVYIIRAVRRYHPNGNQLSKGTESLRRKGVGESFLWACNSNGTSDTILTWHIATCILEVRYPYRHGFGLDLDHKITATHLSRYCTYLMVWSPELLPDDEEWSTSLYASIKKDVKFALAGCTAVGSSLTPEAEYEKVIQSLSSNSKHGVTRNGVMLGQQLVELIEGEDTAWMVLAEFWVEMLLYIAPSDNVRGHLEAIARGGELITLLWALLTHAGIMSQPGDAASTDDDVV